MSPGSAPLVAVIVLNWRQVDATLQCLTDLRASGHPALCVLVVDNGSGDGSVERLRAAAGIEVLALAENVGYCRAVNLGLAWAARKGARHVLLLNNDVRLPPDFLVPMVAVLEGAHDVAGVMPTLVGTDGRVWSEGGVARFGPNLVQLRRQGRAPAPVTAGPDAVDFLPGACALYRLGDLQAVGGVEEAYFMYMEDAELGERLRRHGKRLVHLPWISAVHAAGTSSGGGRSRLRKFLMGRNAVLFARRNPALTRWIALVLFEILLAPFAALLSPSPRVGWAKVRGVWRGLRGGSVGATDVEANL